jgi:hypothetical protein
VPSSISSSNLATPRPRGRVVLLWGLGAFVAVQLTASVVYDYACPQVRYPDFYATVNRVDAGGLDADVLCLGSSRTGFLLNEAQIDPVVRDLTGDAGFHCVNASVPGGDVIVCERLLRILLARGARPRYALIEVSPEMVSQRNSWVKLYGPWFLRWDDVPTYTRDLVITQSWPRFAGTRLLPLYYYREQSRRRVAAQLGAWYDARPTAAPPVPPRNPGRTIGSIAHAQSAKWQKLVADGLRAVDNKPGTIADIGFVNSMLRDFRPGGTSAAALERMLACCRAHCIEPILIHVPLSSGHRDCYTSEIEASFRAYVSAITQKYGCQCVDYQAALPDRFFVDHHHVGVEGRALFSRRLGLEVLAPAWSASAGGR